MALTPLKGKPRAHEFVVFDLEWWPGTYELRIVGVYDKRKGYRYYPTIEAFLYNELTKAAQSRRFYAHFGGSSDMIFLLQHVLEQEGWTAKAIFAGSSAVVTRVSKGGPRSWTFVDSGFLIRRPLRDIGEWLGRAKGSKEAMLSPDFGVMRDYNEQDCVILYEAIERLQGQVNGLGGELRTTLASTALDLFRRGHLKRKIAVRADTNTLAREAYIASRVEPFRKVCERGEYFDINSSFPTSMAKPQPAEPNGIRKTLPELGRGALFLARLSVTVPDMYLPPVPWRSPDGRILFPTGSWSGVFDSADVELLVRVGGKINSVEEVTTFEPFEDLATYVHTLYALKESATGYEREVFKLFLNALYGKFGERSEKREILIRPDDTSCKCDPPCDPEDPCLELIAPGIWSRRMVKDVAHAHVPISVHTTALSRALLYESLEKASLLYYCDTDSVVCGPHDRLPTGPKLGELKHEYSIRDGVFLAPKLYAFSRQGDYTCACADPDGKCKLHVVKAKGFSRIRYPEFVGLAEGRSYEVTRMQRVRESIAKDGTITPRDLHVKKRVYLEKSKRRQLDDGNTAPWSVEELAAQLG